MTSLRKLWFVLLLSLLVSLCAFAYADKDVSLAPAPGQVTLKGKKRTLLFREDLGTSAEFLGAMGMTREQAEADWDARGVVVQAWSPIQKKYSCLEITVLQDDDSAKYFDLMHHPDDKAAWNEFKASFKNSEYWAGQGYTFQSSEQKHAGASYYLLLKYKRSFGAGEYRGYMARTVYQGYTVVFDLKVYNQLPVDSNTNELYQVISTFTAAAASPAGSADAAPAAEGGAETAAPEDSSVVSTTGSVPLTVTAPPPAETNTNTFTVEGTTEPGLHLIGVLMRLNSDTPLRFETDANNRTGAFRLKVTIPEGEENVWLMTLNVFREDTLVAETVFNTTLYKKTLIPLELDAPVPDVNPSEELVLAGTTMKGVEVQCLVTCDHFTWEKKSTPNGTGRFTFKIPMTNEGEYSIALVLSKKNYETKRFSWTVSRTLTDEARKALIRKQALRIGYNSVATRIDQYVNKIMTFSGRVIAMDEIGDEWRITVAGAESAGHYSQLLIFNTEQEPAFSVEEKHTFYGKCIGPYQFQSEESVESVPAFDLIFWE